MAQATPTSPPHSLATLQVTITFTPEQSFRIFEIALKKAEEERAAASAKANLELECIRRESDARIAATRLAATAAGPKQKTKTPTAQDSNTVLEIPPEISRLLLRFGGLPQEELVKIFHNRFNPINLYRLSYKQHIGKGIRKEDRLREPRKTSGSYENSGNLVHEVWSQSFLNYTSIFIAIFGNIAPGLDASMFRFYSAILQLSKVYKWKEGLLPLAIEVHSHILAKQPTDPKNWVIPPELEERCCTPKNRIGMRTVKVSRFRPNTLNRPKDTASEGKGEVKQTRKGSDVASWKREASSK